MDDGSGKRAKRAVYDRMMKYALLAIASITVVIIFFIILFIFTNSLGAIKEIGIIDFLTGRSWEISSDSYGALPLITGTVLVTLGAILIALPLGLGSAIFISEVAPKRLRNILKPICEVFAGIPSVVYGFFGLIVLVPMLRGLFPDHLLFGTSWLAGSIILGIMALPTIISVSEDAMRAVPSSYREASMAMGATRWETTRKIVVPAAISGIAAATILGIGRAIGETMAVMMVTGNSPIIPAPLWNFFEMLRVITATLALEMPDAVAGSTHYSALFLLALILMLMVLAVNYVAKMVIKRSRRRFGDATAPSAPVRKIAGYAKTAKKMPRSMHMLFAVCLAAFVFIISMFFTDDLRYSLLCALAVVGIVVLILMIKSVKRTDYGDNTHGRPQPRSSRRAIAAKRESQGMNNFMITNHTHRFMRSLILTGAFVFAWMMASLFTDNFTAVLFAFAVLIVLVASIPVARKMG